MHTRSKKDERCFDNRDLGKRGDRAAGGETEPEDPEPGRGGEGVPKKKIKKRACLKKNK